MKQAVFIHGFAGSIHSETVGNLRKYNPDVQWFPLEVNHNVEQSLQIIQHFLQQHPDIDILVGSSLGGYYVLCTPFTGKKIVINPVLNPMAVLKKHVGLNQYRGRRENGDTHFKFTMQDLFRFKSYKPIDTPNTICHYTANDPFLGESIKREYQKFFSNAIVTPHLRGHFMDEHYIKHMLTIELNN